ncbi:hypothetical protein DPV78_010813 [Talaromyces pinophilus]|nr:hypothetical protein DPV78_010813 [Talaromyces pinophilus]
MEDHQLSTQRPNQQAAKKIRYIHPDTLLPSIEPESFLEPDLIFDEDHPDIKLHSAPIFIDDGVIVGFWYADPSGNGKRPVYCFIKGNFIFAYRKGDSFILTTNDDFDLLDDLGDWLNEDAEHENAISLEAVRVWTEMMWESKVYARAQDMALEY